MWYWRRVLDEGEPRRPSAAAPAPLARRWSVLVPCRDEARGLPLLLGDLRAQTAVPEAFEVIVVDDHSTDATARLAREAGVRVIGLPEGERGKKAALTRGVGEARHSWVATLDADVRVGPGWLAALDAAARAGGCVAVAAPVHLAPARGWFGRWQALDFCGMMLITAASLRMGRFAMGNGANLAFAKTAFAAVDGYAVPEGKEAASGDDMVLLGKLRMAYPGGVRFARGAGAAATTRPHATLGGFVQQRWRWSAKTGLNQQGALTLTLGLVWAFHVALALTPLLWWLGPELRGALALGWLLKAGADAALLSSATRSFGRAGLLRWRTYPLDLAAHVAYVAGIGALALLPLDFTWKGRRHRR